ncbi:MAG: 2Fe-2S iron-sulfur cluster-binding protein [Deltaproteobacteria bacterium]
MSDAPTAPADDNQVRLTIDGQELVAEKGQMLLQVALDNGVEIPHYCYHPKLSIDGSCRMCQVHVEGGRKLAISCNEPVRDGMVVDTKCEEVEQARKGVLELLLVNHPLDCPICDQAGECFLQDYSFGYGRDHARTTAPRRKGVKREPIGEHVIFDQERCILCRRCVRFTNEISKTDELRVFGIGDHSHIGTLPEAPLNNDYSVNVADVCPVGALLSSDFHHKRRVWFLEDTESVCPSCSKGCNVQLGVFKNEVQRLVPRRNDEVNDTWMCDHGRLRYAFLQDETRIRAARAAENGSPAVAVSLDDALGRAAEALKAAKENPASLAVVASPHLTNEESFRFAALVSDTLAAAHMLLAIPLGDSDDFLIQAEKAANGRGAREVGAAVRGHDAEALLAAIENGEVKTLYCVGSELLQAADEALVLAAVAKLDMLIVQDSNESALSAAATIVLPGLTFAEKDGSFTNGEGRVQRIRRALNAPEGLLSDGEIFAVLEARISGAAENAFDAASTLEAIAAAVPEYAGMSFARLGDQGVPVGEGVVLPAPEPAGAGTESPAEGA